MQRSRVPRRQGRPWKSSETRSSPLVLLAFFLPLANGRTSILDRLQNVVVSEGAQNIQCIRRGRGCMRFICFFALGKMRNGLGDIHGLETRRAKCIGNLQELCDDSVGLFSLVLGLGLRRMVFQSTLSRYVPWALRISWFPYNFRLGTRTFD